MAHQSFSREVEGVTTIEAYEIFLQKIFIEGKGLPTGLITPTIVEQGDADGKGCTRNLWHLVKEEIVSASKPDSFEFVATGFCFPAYDHKSTVTFESLEEKEAIRVTWSVTYKPYVLMSQVARGMVTWTYEGGMNAFVKEVSKSKAQKSKNRV
mmetsp:Transcript_3049/g.3860  ORF Transcript_3049/g.3860 Transcript_3049/m.3860 type:complete len:153 (+) Transcript_3049:173-631(+)